MESRVYRELDDGEFICKVLRNLDMGIVWLANQVGEMKGF